MSSASHRRSSSTNGRVRRTRCCFARGCPTACADSLGATPHSASALTLSRQHARDHKVGVAFDSGQLASAPELAVLGRALGDLPILLLGELPDLERWFPTPR